MVGLRTRFRFHGELNDFLSSSKRNIDFEQVAGSTDTLKHIIESIGVPHTEVGSITVNGESSGLDRGLPDAAEVHVYPHLLPVHIAEARFVLDGHLGRLAAYLRMIGVDTWYERFADDPTLASVSSFENRLLLTRDVGLLKRREVRQGYCVRSDKPHAQLREVVDRFALFPYFAPFTRCMECNGKLMPVPKEDVAELLPPHTRETKNEFSRCANCGKIYWRGSHHARMLDWIRGLEEPARSAQNPFYRSTGLAAS